MTGTDKEEVSLILAVRRGGRRTEHPWSHGFNAGTLQLEWKHPQLARLTASPSSIGKNR